MPLLCIELQRVTHSWCLQCRLVLLCAAQAMAAEMCGHLFPACIPAVRLMIREPHPQH